MPRTKQPSTWTANIKPETWTWKIPSISIHQKQLLCDGYVKRNFNKQITHAIIKLFAKYYTKDQYSLNQIKNFNKFESFNSPLFMLHSLIWYIRISIHQDVVSVCLCLASYVPRICMRYTITLQNKTVHSMYNDDIICRLPENYSTLCAVSQIQTLDTLNIKINTTSLSVAFRRRKILQKYMNRIVFNPFIVRCHWRVSDFHEIDTIQNVHNKSDWSIVSNPFEACINTANSDSLKYYLQLFREKKNIYLSINCILLPSNVSKISIKCDIFINETQINKAIICRFSSNNDKCKVKMLNCDEITNLNEINILCNLIIFNIIDNNNHRRDDNKSCDIMANSFSLINCVLYEWLITDIETVKRIKYIYECYNDQNEVASNIFEAYGFKWYISLQTYTEYNNKSYNFFLHMIIPDGYVTKRVKYFFMFKLSLNNYIQAFYHTFDINNDNIGYYALITCEQPLYCSVDNIQNAQYVKFELEMKLFDVFDVENNKLITDQYMINNPIKSIKKTNFRLQNAEWNISTQQLNNIAQTIDDYNMNSDDYEPDEMDLPNSDVFELFSMKYCMQTYINTHYTTCDQDCFDLELVNMSDISRYSSIIMRYTVIFENTNIMHTGIVKFEKFNKYGNCSKSHIICECNNFRSLNQCKIRLIVELLDLIADDIDYCYDSIISWDDNNYDIDIDLKHNNNDSNANSTSKQTENESENKITHTGNKRVLSERKDDNPLKKQKTQ